MKLQSNYTGVHFTGRNLGRWRHYDPPEEAVTPLPQKSPTNDQGMGSKVTRPDLDEFGAVAGTPVKM
jgi:hypothetical protein